MRIETRDAVIPPREPQKPHRTHPGVVGRAVFAIVLAACLFVALRWALSVTNANAHQLSTNLTNLQDGLEKPPSTAAPLRRPPDTQGKPTDGRSVDGPILEPVESR
jgi:hypothetical protein